MTDPEPIRSNPNIIWTIGHSNLPLEQFLHHLRDVELLADVRRFPHSPKFPHFNGEALQQVKDYRWFQDLGGRRREKGERHPAWRVAAFRAYAGYMETEPFRQALSALEEEARRRRSVVMCAEALWWRCHRRLISDALLVRGWRVVHLPQGRDHELSPMARLEADGRIVYDRACPDSPNPSSGRPFLSG
ncbi:MAG TPA: DUF488 domain-containing protein [Planctomycetota bacterium]|nr:DUF488 domain-containing protein [Planctomycetota bacterium]